MDFSHSPDTTRESCDILGASIFEWPTALNQRLSKHKIVEVEDAKKDIMKSLK